MLERRSRTTTPLFVPFLALNPGNATADLLCSRRCEGGGALSDTAIRRSVCPSPRRAVALGYMHAGCLQRSQVRTADPSADGRRSAASRTAIGYRLAAPGAITCSYSERLWLGLAMLLTVCNPSRRCGQRYYVFGLSVSLCVRVLLYRAEAFSDWLAVDCSYYYTGCHRHYIINAIFANDDDICGPPVA